jgi:AcrR family transcriptional regulator
MKPKELILAKALELYNENGIEYVGMRELAVSLDLKLGNITYYFPTKESLVYQISLDLSVENSKILAANEDLTLVSFLEMMQKQFENQYRFRCLFLSFVHLIRQYESISSRYVEVEQRRKNTIIENIGRLVKNGCLRKLSDKEVGILVSSVSLIARFWISEAAISQNKLKPSLIISHYLNLLANIMLPYCTERGAEEIRGIEI